MDVFSEISSLMKETDVKVLSVRYDLMVNRITPFFTCNRNPGFFDKLNVFARDVNDLLEKAALIGKEKDQIFVSLNSYSHQCFTTMENIYYSILFVFLATGYRIRSILLKVEVRIDEFMKSGLYIWVNKGLVLSGKNLLALKSYDKLLYAFCLFPYLYQDCFDIPFVYLNVVCLQIVSRLFNFNGNLREAYDLHMLLVVVVSSLEGVTPYNYPTISYHYMLHIYDTIKIFGVIKDLDTRYTEISYRLEKRNNICSSNPDKTIDKRMLVRNYYEVHAYAYIQKQEKNIRKFLKHMKNNDNTHSLSDISAALDALVKDIQRYRSGGWFQ